MHLEAFLNIFLLYKPHLLLMAVMLMSDACFAQDATQAVAAEPSWAEKLYYWFIDHMNYWTVLVLMAIESSLYFSLRA